ncbi:MAG: hypothetical protein U9Q35_03310 [Pseudomonadota bacterium]|nr:hypothetical protein [Pseudomonadota bacterium]
MFEDLIKEMECLNGQRVSTEIQADEKGYIDKQCPAEECEFIFKVNEQDWGDVFKDEAVWCPMCRHEAPADQWFTKAQVEYAHEEALAVVQGKINNALRSGARKFNRQQPKNSFVSMSMKVSGGSYRTHTIPAKAAELMQLEIQCEECSSRFAVVGSAYFCPGCGHNSVTRTFSDSLRKIQAKKDNVDLVRKTLSDSVGADEAELTCRSMLETCISDGVVAFQKYCEGLYSQFGNAPFNAFQRLDQASSLWEQAIQKRFGDWLTDEELTKLSILYQKRHLLAHNEGIVDERYIERSGDSTYKAGQRIVIREHDIEFLVTALRKLSEGIKTNCQNA